MPTFQVLKSYEVPKPEGGYYSKGVVVDLDEKSAEKYKAALVPYAINDGAAGPEARIGYTQSQIDAIVEERIASSIGMTILREIEGIVAPIQGDRSLTDAIRELVESVKGCDPKSARLNQLKAMKLDDLRAIANDTEIENMHDLNKADLVTAIMGVEFPVEPKQEA